MKTATEEKKVVPLRARDTPMQTPHKRPALHIVPESRPTRMIPQESFFWGDDAIGPLTEANVT